MDNVRGRKVNGGSFPAVLFRRFMSEATKGVDAGPFANANTSRGKLLTPPKGVILPTTTTSSTVAPETPSTTAAGPTTTPPTSAVAAPPTTATPAAPPTTGLLGLGSG
jgi:hypothetical protein